MPLYLLEALDGTKIEVLGRTKQEARRKAHDDPKKGGHKWLDLAIGIEMISNSHHPKKEHRSRA